MTTEISRRRTGSSRWLRAMFAAVLFTMTAAIPVATAADMSPAAAEKTKFLLPSPKEAISLDGGFKIKRHTGIVVDHNATADDMAVAKLLAEELGKAHNASLPIRKRVSPMTIRLHRVKQWGAANKYHGLDVSRDLGPEGYVLQVTNSGITIVASTDRGLFYGTRTLIQLAQKETLPAIRIVDWPDVKNRMVLYDQRDNTVVVDYWKHWIGELSGFKVNQIMPFLEDDFQYGGKYPYLGKPNTFTAAKAGELVDYARVRKMQIVPQLESFGHADGLLSHHELSDMRHNGKQWQFSPCSLMTYEVFGDLYRELSRAFPQSPMFHIGSDEVGGWEPNHSWHLAEDARCAAAIANGGGETQVFVDHIHRLQGLLAHDGRSIAMWGDEILTHPELAGKLNKNITIFDWNYEETKSFPTLRKFKDWGFQHIYAAPAVHGFNDLYPLYPISFGNIPAFTRAAVAEGIDGVCITMWGMIEGGNAENYLYGMAYASQAMWNSQHTDIADFNRRFAAQWFGITANGAADHVDRLFWWPWRTSGSAAWDHKEYTGYWQELFGATRVVFWAYQDIAKDLTDDELRTRIAQSKDLLVRIESARASLQWIKSHATRNTITIDSAEEVMTNYEHMARKAIAVYTTALDYRTAVASGDVHAAKSALLQGASSIRALKADYPQMRRNYTRAIATRNGDPRDLPAIDKVEASLDKFVEALEAGATSVDAGNVPTPKDLALGK